MSPPGGRRCPPVLLALLLALPGSRGFPECQDQTWMSMDVSAEGSLCLTPEEPRPEWREVEWRAKQDSGGQQRILTALRDGSVSYPNGSFHGRAHFQPQTLSLCVSPVRKADSGVYKVEMGSSSSGISSRCFRVAVWDPVRPPQLETQILRHDRGRCLVSLLCSSAGNVSQSWACPGDAPGAPQNGSRLLRSVPEAAEPQICVCNVSSPAGWSAARARLACPGPGISSAWAAAAAGLILLLALSGGCCCWRRKRSNNSREATPGAPPGPPEQPLTIYAEVGVKKPSQDPTRTSEATQEGATIYAAVSPRTLEHPRRPEEPGNRTVYSTVQFGHRPSSSQKKRLDRALVSTAYLEDNGGYRRLGFPTPAGHQRP